MRVSLKKLLDPRDTVRFGSAFEVFQFLCFCIAVLILCYSSCAISRSLVGVCAFPNTLLGLCLHMPFDSRELLSAL